MRLCRTVRYHNTSRMFLLNVIYGISLRRCCCVYNVLVVVVVVCCLLTIAGDFNNFIIHIIVYRFLPFYTFQSSMTLESVYRYLWLTSIFQIHLGNENVVHLWEVHWMKPYGMPYWHRKDKITERFMQRYYPERVFKWLERERERESKGKQVCCDNDKNVLHPKYDPKNRRNNKSWSVRDGSNRNKSILIRVILSFFIIWLLSWQCATLYKYTQMINNRRNAHSS